MGRWLNRLNSQKVTKNDPTKPTIRESQLNVGNVGLKLVENERKTNKSRHVGRWLGRLQKQSNTMATLHNKLNVGNVGAKLAKTKKSKVWRITVKTGERIDKVSMIDPERMSYRECEKMLIEKFGANRVIRVKEKGK